MLNLYQNSWGKVGRELGLRYVLEGSVRRRQPGDRVSNGNINP
jgi:TolB-like protein